MKQRVHLVIEGEVVLGDLFLPATPGPHPAVVVAGPMTSVKEQVTGVYACALATRGIAALSIDPRHFGESGGSPRQYEHFEHKIADLKASLRWLAEQPNIDRGRLGFAGICLGAGYAMWAAVDNPLVQTVGAVAGYYRHPSELRAKDPDGFDAKVNAGKAAREHYEATGEAVVVPAVALEGDAAMTLAETFDYYGTRRAAVPNYVNAFAVMSREHFLGFDVQAAASRVRASVFMVHSENALSPAWARRFHDHLEVEKRIEWIASKGQVDFYDDPALVAKSCDLLAKHALGQG